MAVSWQTVMGDLIGAWSLSGDCGLVDLSLAGHLTTGQSGVD